MSNEENLDNVLSHFCESSGTSFNKKTQADTTGKKSVLTGVGKFINNVNTKNYGHKLNKNKNQSGKMK